MDSRYEIIKNEGYYYLRTFVINKRARQGRANETPRTSAGLIAILLLMDAWMFEIDGWEIRIYTVTFEGIHAMQGTFGKFCTYVPVQGCISAAHGRSAHFEFEA